MPDESRGSPKQKQHQASPESHLPDVPQASPINGNGPSGASVPSEQASPKVASVAGASAASEHLTNATRSSSSDPDPKNPDSDSDHGESSGQEAFSEDGEAEYCVRSEPLRDEGPMLDLLRVYYNGWSSVNVCLIEWEGRKPKISQVNHSITVNGLYKSTPNLPDGLRKSLLLPAALTPYGDIRYLFGTIQSRLEDRVRLSETQAQLLTYWCLATWFPEYLSFVPRLTITGPKLAADSLIQVLHSVCCKPIPLASINSAILKAIPFSEFIPTLLIRSSRLNKAVLEFLDASDAKGFFFANGEDLQKSQTVKCMYLGEDLKQPAFTSDGIHIHLAKNAFLPNSPSLGIDEIERLQNQLFFYRVYNRSLVQHSTFRVRELIPELCAVAQQLGAVVPEDKSLQKRVIDLFARQNEQSCTDRAFALSGVVLRAVLHHCHQPDRQKILVHEIADTVNDMYKDLGEPMKFSSESVGHALKSIGLYTRRLGSSGRGLILDGVTKREAHELSRVNEIIPDGTGSGGCTYCGKADPAADELM